MPRKPAAIPSVEWKLHIPAPLAAKVELLLADPVRGKARYGARSELLIILLSRWIATLDAPGEAGKNPTPSTEEGLARMPESGTIINPTQENP